MTLISRPVLVVPNLSNFKFQISGSPTRAGMEEGGVATVLESASIVSSFLHPVLVHFEEAPLTQPHTSHRYLALRLGNAFEQTVSLQAGQCGPCRVCMNEGGHTHGASWWTLGSATEVAASVATASVATAAVAAAVATSEATSTLGEGSESIVIGAHMGLYELV